LGFAVPSNTILREISSIISTGTYRGHSFLGVTGSDMSFDIAQQIKSSVTYGWKLASITSKGPSDGKLKVNDIIIALNGTLIRNNDDLASYLEEKTLPLESLVVTVMRNNQRTDVPIILATRPAPTS
jgi:S1-C subfamily serine protease